MTYVPIDIGDEEFVVIDVSDGCSCNIFKCEHKLRLWSRLWYQGIRRRMPLVLDHPSYLFKVKL